MESLLMEKPDKTGRAERTGKIVGRAASLGFERCGIIGLDAMKGFAEKLAERISRFPESEQSLKSIGAFMMPEEKFQWGRSVVVCSWRNGVYRVPKHLDGLIGKAYLSDGRRDEKSDEYRASRGLVSYMSDELGLRVASSADGWVAPYRWAAQLTGLGVIRKNNFFYGDHGSYYFLSAFLIDDDLEHIYASDAAPCPESCGLCVRSCPTESLGAPFAMNMTTCVSYLTALSRDEGAFKKHSGKIGGWVYGCDVCQDVCPFNKGQLTGEAEFPGLEELSRNISLEKIVTMDYGYLRDVMAVKFWYIGRDDVWKWKRNALTAMLNNYNETYSAAIEAACEDEDERVRETARMTRSAIGV
jgi:epoxyqueuosine reductase